MPGEQLYGILLLVCSGLVLARPGFRTSNDICKEAYPGLRVSAAGDPCSFACFGYDQYNQYFMVKQPVRSDNETCDISKVCYRGRCVDENDLRACLVVPSPLLGIKYEDCSKTCLYDNRIFMHMALAANEHAPCTKYILMPGICKGGTCVIRYK